MGANVRVLLFSTARQAAGSPRIERTVPESGVPLASFLSELGRDYPKLRTVLSISRLVRNGEFVPRERTRVLPGDEIAVHPPYSGG